MATNTFWCWPEKDEHGTTAFSSYEYQAGWSQNLLQKTVTAITRWRKGTENPAHIKYRQNQIDDDSYAATAMRMRMRIKKRN